LLFSKLRAKKRATVDHYEAIYKSYKEKYEKYPLAVQRKLKEEELASWEENYKEATRMAEETAKKLICLEAAVSQKGYRQLPLYQITPCHFALHYMLLSVNH